MKACVKCGATDELTRDHIIPRWIYKRSNLLQLRGLKKNLGAKNYQWLCDRCNSKKGGSIDVSTEIGRDFWLKLRDAIDEQLRKVKN